MEINIDDKVLLRSALIVSFIGLFILFIIMYTFEIPEKNISELNELNNTYLGKKIKVTGIFEDLKHSTNNKSTFIKISQKCTIDIVSFEYINYNESFYGQDMVIEGTLDEYNGKKEMLADKIYFVNKN